MSEFMFQVLVMLKGIQTKGESGYVKNIVKTQVLIVAIGAAIVCRHGWWQLVGPVG